MHPFSLVRCHDVNIVFHYTVCIVNNFIIDWQMSNNANNLFEHIKKSPYFSKRPKDMKKPHIVNPTLVRTYTSSNNKQTLIWNNHQISKIEIGRWFICLFSFLTLLGEVNQSSFEFGKTCHSIWNWTFAPKNSWKSTIPASIHRVKQRFGSDCLQ